MRLFRGRPAYPKDRDLVRVVEAAASRLADELERLDVSSLDLSTATRRVFECRRGDFRTHVQSCAHAFAWSLPRNERPFTDLSLVAFNDGLGVSSLLAKECSIGTVTYHDSDDVLRGDARAIARAIGYPADRYVFGDADEIEFVLERSGIACDVFVSSDGGAPGRATASPERLITLLNTLSNRTKGALSFGLTLDYGSPGGTPVTNLDTFKTTFDRAGFETIIVRGPNPFSLPPAARGSGRPVVLAGSRVAGAGLTDAQQPASAPSSRSDPSRTRHESVEVT
jgi:hypothetical protein